MKILKELNLDDVVFLDIETVRIVDKLEKGTPLWDSWDYKLRYSREAEKFDGGIEEQFEKKAALFAEFAKIVTVTIGRVKGGKIVLKSYTDHDERKLLKEFCGTLNALIAKNKYTRLAGHAIKGFDVPFLMRRCLINGVELPSLLDVGHLKPWEVNMIDTLELWKATGFYGASLLNISTAFGLPSPKSDINGSETSDVYWKGNADVVKPLDRITAYCEGDVATVANIVLMMRGEQPVESELSEIKAEKVPLMEKIFNSGKMSESDAAEIKTLTESMDEEERKIAGDILNVTVPKVKKARK